MTEAWQEKPFEWHISDELLKLDEGWRVSDTDDGFDPETGLFWADFAEFVEKTAPEKAEKMRRELGERWEARLRLALVNSLKNGGTALTLRKGFSMAGYRNVQCMAPYPDDPRVDGARERYDANILRFVHQVHYQTAGTKSLDFALFVNGIAVATGEVKTELTQTVQDAIDEYCDNRRPVEPGTGRKNPLLTYKRGAVVHFAVSEEEVWMCTNLGPFPSPSARPRFLPFNMGDHGHAGNPEAPSGQYRTHYLWDWLLRRDNWLSIFDRFVFEEVERKQDATGRWRVERTLIFPRYHQFDCERRILSDVVENGPGGRYLVEHSAGSGKTETITWCAHDLARARSADGSPLFSSVVVVTDRLSLDDNIKKTIGQLSTVTGQVVMVGRDADGRISEGGSKSSQLVAALGQHREIVVVTIQTFLYAWPDIARLDDLAGASFAVIIDEAHSSQEGSSATSLKTAFNAAADKMRFSRLLDLEDEGDMTDEEVIDAFFSQMQEGSVMPENVTFVAFTATPKAETKTLFGTPTGETDEAGNPIMGSFHLYPMRQAVEEGYIIDPLTGYLPMKTVTKIEGAPADGALVDERAARRRIATWRTLHPTNVMDKAKWIVDHFVDNVAPLLGGQAKAMVVTASRPAVVRYKYAMDAYIASRPELDASEISAKLRFKVPGEPLVAFSDKVSGAKCVMDEDEYLEDNPFALIDRDVSYSEGSLNPRGTGDVADAFDRPENRLLIVADKFQTGFDQKKLVALYVDKKLGNAIEVVQTYSRVNRTYPGKDKVFVVDFANDPEDVLSAFRTYDSGAVMETAQDPDVVYEVKRDLDGDGIYTTAEVEEFRSAFYRSKREAADDDGDGTWRSVLYDAVSDPAHRFADSLRSAQDSHATWSEVARSAAQEGDVAAQAEAEARASAAAERVAELSTFKRRLKKYCSAYNLVSQMVFLDDPALEVFYAFAKLLSHRIEKASPDEVDISGLVLSDYRIVPQKVPASAAGGPLHPMGAGAAAHPPRRETLEKVVERLNSTWGDEGDPLMKARAVNYVADKVATDEVTTTQIANTHNSKEAILSEGRLRNVVIRALMAMMSNELGDLAGRALDDPQAIDPLVDQVYDLIASGRRYDMEELAAFLRDAGERA